MKIEFDPFAGSTDPSAPAEGEIVLRVAISHGIDHDDAGRAYLAWVEAEEVEVLDGATGRVRAQAYPEAWVQIAQRWLDAHRIEVEARLREAAEAGGPTLDDYEDERSDEGDDRCEYERRDE